MIIIGAGLSGLIAASMLRDQVDFIMERQPSLPNNHSALLRFRSSIVGDAVGVPFKQVKVMKAVQPWRNPVADAVAYSIKCTGRAELRSIAGADGAVETRFIAPSDLIARLDRQVGSKIRYGVSLIKPSPADGVIISTMPMPMAMDLLGWEDKPAFNYREGTVINCEMPEEVDLCATVYLPDPLMIPYRVSVTDRQLIVEMSGRIESTVSLHRAANQALEVLGLTNWQKHVEDRKTSKIMQYAKIAPIPESIRRRFMLWASEHHNFYSLGRFATWRPGLLLDDIVNDVRMIERMIKTPGDTYRHKLKG